MTSSERSTLVRLADTDETVATGDEDIRGRHVLDNSGQDLGKIDALLIDSAAEKVRFIEVATGGFLGLGTTKSLIPVDAITSIDGKDVHINQSTATVAGAPVYDPELETDSHGFYENTYGYYGFVPYWGLGYSYPVPSQADVEDPRRA